MAGKAEAEGTDDVFSGGLIVMPPRSLASTPGLTHDQGAHPVRRTCSVCSGTGFVPLSAAFAGICTSCWGTGRVDSRDVCRHCGAWPDEGCRRRVGIGEVCLRREE